MAIKIEIIEETQRLISEGVIFADPNFVSTPAKDLQNIVNGCGASNAKFDYVPDTIYGLYTGHACNIHDLMYFSGETLEDKERADRIMLNNMLRLIEREDGWYQWVLKPLRRRRAMKYYEAVIALGGPAFWEGKN